jgi:hypothetical protein
MLTPRPNWRSIGGQMEADMTELERAREHLLVRQEMLAEARKMPLGPLTCLGYLDMMEQCFLAALSWVWEEQEKAKTANDVYLEVVACWEAMVEMCQ